MLVLRALRFEIGYPVSSEPSLAWPLMRTGQSGSHASHTTEPGLGGCFYDHLCTSSGTIVGVRYWVDQTIAFDQHPVFGRFLEDARFKVNQSDGYVDIVFDQKDVAAFRSGEWGVETVQDFGGDRVVKLGDSFGIAFDL